jgi:hypothetical protein
MPKPDPDFKRVHGEADKIEPRMRRAMVAFGSKVAARVPVADIERALEQGDTRRAIELIDAIDIEDALAPSSRIVRDAFLRGGRAEAEDIVADDPVAQARKR